MKVNEIKRLSALTWADLTENSITSMKDSSNDILHLYIKEADFNRYKETLLQRYGDFDVTIVESEWGNRSLEYLGEAFQSALNAHKDSVQAWCDKYGCE